MKQQRFICPVCGFNGLQEPPFDLENHPSYEICLCCGYEFGFDDRQQKMDYDSYRREWITNGAAWFDISQKPSFWDLKKQLENIGYGQHEN